MLPFAFTEEYMDWGLVSGGAAMLGVLYNFIRIGEWKARQETRLDGLEKRQDGYDGRVEGLILLINKQNELLTELKVKLDLMLADKNRRKRKDD